MTLSEMIANTRCTCPLQACAPRRVLLSWRSCTSCKPLREGCADGPCGRELACRWCWQAMVFMDGQVTICHQNVQGSTSGRGFNTWAQCVRLCLSMALLSNSAMCAMQILEFTARRCRPRFKHVCNFLLQVLRADLESKLLCVAPDTLGWRSYSFNMLPVAPLVPLAVHSPQKYLIFMQQR